MSTALTAPGVYIREIPSGTRTIAGVATSITAFVGAALRGPTNAPTLCTSWSEFERRFGGLWAHSPMSQAVRHFFLNGGSQALVVRVVNGDRMLLQPTAALASAAGASLSYVEAVVTNTTATTCDLDLSARDASGAVIDSGGAVPLQASATITFDAATEAAQIAAIVADGVQIVELVGDPTAAPPAEGSWTTAANAEGTYQMYIGTGSNTAATTLATGFRLVASSPGAWGNHISAEIDTTDAPTDTFHLTLTETDDDDNPVAQEVYYAVSLDESASRWLGRLLELQSALCRLESAAAAVASVPSADPPALSDGTDGEPPTTDELVGSDADRTGMYALRNADLFNLLCIPMSSWDLSDAGHTTLWGAASTFCEEERAFLIIDPPSDWSSTTNAAAGAPAFSLRSNNSAVYFPRIKAANPLQENRVAEFPPCGVVAGVMARTDAQRGIWKAPAGTDAVARAVSDLAFKLTDTEHGVLNDYGINALRTFPVYGTVVWGSRTSNGANVLASDWKYVPVRRLALYLEESLYRGTQWAVFEPNDEPLWAQLRLSIGSFMHGLFRQGAFAGATPREAYFVKCDSETTTQTDIDLGVVNVIIGFAPLKPAEFVIIKLQQLVSQAA